MIPEQLRVAADNLQSAADILRLYDAADYGRQQWFDDKTISLTNARTAAEPLELKIQGDFIAAADDTDGSCNIRVGDTEAASLPVGTGFRLTSIPFRRVYIDNAAQAGKQVRLIYGVGSRLAAPTLLGNIQSIGSISDPVDINPTGLQDVLNAKAFSQYMALNAGASQYSMTQLYNPSGSGKVLIATCQKNYVASTHAGLKVWGLYSTTTQLANDYTTLASQNLRIQDAATPSGDIRWERAASLIGDQFKSDFYDVNDSHVRNLIDLPIAIPPGTGVVSACGTVNHATRSTWQWIEIDAS